MGLTSSPRFSPCSSSCPVLAILRVAAGAKPNVMFILPPLLTPGACRLSPNRERQAPGGWDLYRRWNPEACRLFHKQSQVSPSVPKLWARLPPIGSERTESSRLPRHLRLLPRSGTKSHSHLLMHDLFFSPFSLEPVLGQMFT